MNAVRANGGFAVTSTQQKYIYIYIYVYVYVCIYIYIYLSLDNVCYFDSLNFKL